jgi:peptidoglycan/xylan/chitin deacetylase (PgdA/CDA1 family)
VITSFPTTQKEVWITIDDGPHPENTPEILAVLASYHAKATFFGIGEKILQWPHLARAIKAAGHQLQNHTFRHPVASYWAALPNRAEREIIRCSDAIFQSTGERPLQLRAPAGIANPFVHASAQKAGLQMIGWSAAGLDGLPHNPQWVVQKILQAVRPGAIILLHEGSLRGLPAGTRARTLERLLQGLTERGYRAILPMLSR